MATSREKLNLLIGARDKATPVLSKLKSSIMAVGAAYLGWQVVTRVIGDIIEKATESEKVWNDVTASLERHNFSVEKGIGAVKRFSSAMQRMTGISDEVVGTSIQMLLDYNNDLATSFDLVKVASDLSAGGHMDMKAAIDLVGKASVGYTGTLSRYGIIIDEAIPKNEKFAEAIRQINQRFGGAAAARMETYAGKIELLKQNIGDLEEDIGDLLIPTLSDLTNSFNTLFDNVTRQQEEGAFVQFATFISNLVGIFGMYGPAVQVGIDVHNILNDAVAKSNEQLEELGNKSGDAYGNLSTKSQEIVATLQDQSEEVHILSDAYAELAQFSLQELMVTFGLTADAAVELAIAIQEAGFQMKDHIQQTVYGAKELEDSIDLDKVALSSLAGAMQTQFSKVTGVLRKIGADSKNVFVQMYFDFVANFGDAVLEYLAKEFAKKFLMKLLFFDVPANDRMAANEGRRYGMFFERGLTDYFSNRNIGMTLATSAAPTAMNTRKSIVSTIEDEAIYGLSTVVADNRSTLTGYADSAII